GDAAGTVGDGDRVGGPAGGDVDHRDRVEGEVRDVEARAVRMEGQAVRASGDLDGPGDDGGEGAELRPSGRDVNDGQGVAEVVARVEQVPAGVGRYGDREVDAGA